MRCSPRWGVAVMVLAGLTPGCGGDASPPASAPVEAVVPEDPAAEIARLKAVGGDDAGALYQAGIELARRSEPAAAAQKLEAARDLAPGNSIIQRSLWVVYGTLGRPDDALAALENAVRLDPKNLDASLDLVAEHVRRSHLDKARAVLDGLEKTYPDSAAVIAARGAVARRAGDADGAREAFNRALSIDAREPEALFGLGVLARQAGETSTAKERFSAALQVNPDHVGALMGLGGIAFDGNDYEGAASWYLQALRQNPRYFPARRSLGNALLLQGMFDEAVELFRQAVDLEPRNLDAHFYLGKADLQRGLLDDAEKEFEFVARSDQKRIDAFIELSRLFSLRGEIERAYGSIQRAIALGFSDFDLLRTDADFENMMAASTVRDNLAKAEQQQAARGSR